MRGFEKISTNEKGILPSRQTAKSAGYDISVIESAVIKPGEIKVLPTGLKAYMEEDVYLSLHVRSSLGIKKKLILANITGIIDSDYYNNPDNEGHIMVALLNTGSEEVVVEANERVCQGIFTRFLITEDDTASGARSGGIGSTN